MNQNPEASPAGRQTEQSMINNPNISAFDVPSSEKPTTPTESLPTEGIFLDSDSEKPTTPTESLPTTGIFIK